MAINMWTQTDVARLLEALAQAADLHGPEYHKALRDVALCFGIRSIGANPPQTRVLDVAPDGEVMQ